MIKLEHIGIAVKNLKEAEIRFKKLLNTKPYKSETVADEGVTTSFFSAGETKIELLEAIVPGSPVSKFINKRGEGVHHLAFEVDDIHTEIRRLKKEGFELIGEGAKKGADNMLVCFLHPKSSHGVLVELCQKIKTNF